MEVTTITMKRFLILMLLFIIGCKGTSENSLAYKRITGNLYIDQNDNLYVKSIDNTLDGHPKDIYISSIFVSKEKEAVLLNKVIDTTTYEQIKNSNYSKDKNNIYFLRKTLEGGDFDIIADAKLGEFELIFIDNVQYGKLGNIYFYNGEVVEIP